MEVFAEPILYLCYKFQRKEDISVWGGQKHVLNFMCYKLHSVDGIKSFSHFYQCLLPKFAAEMNQFFVWQISEIYALCITLELWPDMKFVCGLIDHARCNDKRKMPVDSFRSSHPATQLSRWKILQWALSSAYQPNHCNVSLF